MSTSSSWLPLKKLSCRLTSRHFHSFLFSFFLFFFPGRGNRNAFSPRCPPRNSCASMTKNQKIFGTICYFQHPPPPPNPDPPSGCWKLWTVSRTHILAQPSEEAPPLPSWANGAQRSLIILIPGWPMARRSPAHMTPLCALPLLSALDPGECEHHWRPDTGGIGRPPSSAELNQALSYANFIAIRRSWPSPRWERRRSAGEEPIFFFLFVPSLNGRRDAGARQ